MSNFKIKDSFLVLPLTYFFLVLFISISDTGYYSDPIDFVLRAAILYSLPLLIFVLPIQKLSRKLVVYTFGLVLLGLIFPIIPLSDMSDLVYVFYYFPLGLIATTIIHFLTTSKYTQSTISIFILLFVCIGVSIALTFTSIRWLKVSAQHSAKHTAYQYLRCNGNSLSTNEFKNICNQLTGEFWQPSYQNICFDQVKQLELNGSVDKMFGACYGNGPRNFNNTDWHYKFTMYFIKYWGFDSIINHN